MVLAMILSKGLGMLRGVLLANHYGINMEANAFSTASRIPLAFFDMLFSAAILGCFIPVYNSFKSENNTFDAESERQADAFACIFLNFIFSNRWHSSSSPIRYLKLIFAIPIHPFMFCVRH